MNGVDAWLAYNVSVNHITEYAKIAVEHKMKRVVFAVPVDDIDGASPQLSSAYLRPLLEPAGINFTVFKYGSLREMEEAKFPYRIVREELPIPVPSEENKFNMLSTSDLYRVSWSCSSI